jgi:hypothetical protein
LLLAVVAVVERVVEILVVVEAVLVDIVLAQDLHRLLG